MQPYPASMSILSGQSSQRDWLRAGLPAGAPEGDFTPL
ncbi:MAG: DUF3349 domain-containing protein [Akkermansiaceae bacterium]|nr:DUF3349 domain-containing protein [Akkermansiaceae bacterium]